MEEKNDKNIEARLKAQEVMLEILCAQLWAQMSPQKLESVGQRYLRMLHESLGAADDENGVKEAIEMGERMLRNALIRASALRSTI